MSLEDIKTVFNNNTLSYNKISAVDLANIAKFVEVKLQMDKSTLDYYYEINVSDLAKSKITNGELETMQKQGWSLSDDSKNLIIFLTN
jgi:hypothetical protein